jgi:hypothetical protein
MYKTGDIYMARNREKFVELAEKRVNKTIKDMRLVGNLSNKTNYSYTQKDAERIVSVLEKELKMLRSRFLSGGEEADESFRLD